MKIMYSCCRSLLFVSTTLSFVWGIDLDSGVQEVTQTYLQELLHVFGNGSEIESHIKTFLDKHYVWSSGDFDKVCMKNVSGSIKVDRDCLLEACLSPEDVYKLSGLDHGEGTEQISALSAILLHQLVKDECMNKSHVTVTDHHHDHDHDHHEGHIHPSSAAVWGLGIMCTTVISLCSLAGAVTLPFVNGNMYRGMLIYMVGLGAGTLCGSSLLCLIPEAFQLEGHGLDEDSYVWKSVVILLGIYLSFLIEPVLKIITQRSAKKKERREKCCKPKPQDPAISIASFHKDMQDSEMICCDPETCCNPEDSRSSSDDQDQDQMMSSGENGLNIDEKQDNFSNPLVPKPGHHHHHVAPVAWMIIFGDGLHNFVDGVSIGAAFTESVVTGVSVSIAILFEELPHELGDFAVLLNSGMKFKKALLYNFLSATMCYLGLVAGIFLGANTSTHTWVFAFAGGMFLYIALKNMMSEMTSAADDPENKRVLGSCKIFLLQNFGLITGFGLIVLLAIYEEDLETAIMNFL